MSAVLKMQPRTAPWGREICGFDRVVIVGQTGSGKTHHALSILETAQRVVVYDPAEDPAYLKLARPTTVLELADKPELLAPDFARFVVHPRLEDFRENPARPKPEAEQLEEIETLCKLLRAAGDLVSVWDECGDYDFAAAPLTKLARNGRHQGIACLFISQCAVEIPLRARRQATRIVSFVQSEPRDLEALADKCGEQFAEKARTWRKGSPPAIWTLPSLE